MNLTSIVPILTVGLLFSGLTLTAANTVGTSPTPEERQKALDFIEQTNRGLFDAVHGLSAAQWNFKPGPDRWSIAEVVEHMALIEDVVNGVLAKMSTAPPPAEGRDVAQIDAQILSKVLDRSEKFKAPPPALPTGRWTTDAALEHFKEGNLKIRAALETMPDLRAHAISHPIFGSWDGYQWILGVTGHTARHTQQILEVKADPGFPSK